jgi:hypothetical protein
MGQVALIVPAAGCSSPAPAVKLLVEIDGCTPLDEFTRPARAVGDFHDADVASVPGVTHRGEAEVAPVFAANAARPRRPRALG